VEVYPLCLPEGEGLCVPQRQGGPGVRQQAWDAPAHRALQVADCVEQRVAGVIVEGSWDGMSSDGTTRLEHFAILLRPGMKAEVPLGMLGEVEIV